MIRMRKQSGHIEKHRGYWRVRYREQSVLGGKIRSVQRSKTLARVDAQHKTRASVRQLADDILEPLNQHRYAPSTVMKLGDFVDRVYLRFVKQHKRPSTHAGYRDMWQRHLQPRCGDWWLRDIRTPEVQLLLEQIAREDGVSKTTLKHIKHLLSGIFRFASQQDYYDRSNPITPVSIPDDAPRSSETYAYSLEEIERMLAILPEPAATVVAVAAFTGLRRGEIRGLEWENYRPAEGDVVATLRVMRSIWNGITSDPKTAKSKAPVPVIGPLATRLEAHRAICGNRVSGPIFINLVGKPLDLNELYKQDMKDILKRANIKWQGWHAFRRGLATNLHRLGVDDKTIQAILRHSNISTTQNIYIKSVPDDAVVAMKRLESEVQQRVN